MKLITIFLAMIGILSLQLTGSSKALAQTGSTVSDQPFILTQLQSNTTVAIKIDTPRIAMVGNPDGVTQSTEALKFLQRNLDSLQSNVDGKPIYGLVDLPFSFGQPHLRMLVEKSSNSEQFMSNLTSQFDLATVTNQGDYLLTSLGKSWFRQLPFTTSRADQARGTLITPGDLPNRSERWSAAIDLIKDYPIQIVVMPPDYLWKTYEETMTELPDELGGGPVSSLTQGLKFMAVGIDLKNMTLVATVQSNSPDSAQQFAELLPVLLARFTLSLPQPYQKACQSILSEYEPQIQKEIQGDRIVYSLKPVADKVKAASQFAVFMENVLVLLTEKEIKPRLRELVLAIHNYESANGCFPPTKASRKPDGSSGLSWRVHILPFLEEMELYEQFKLDEPWDSPHNLPLLKKMPNVFQTGSINIAGKPNSIPEGHTILMAPIGKGTIFGGKEVVTFGKITDGTSNTIMLLAVNDEHAVPWTAPQDFVFDPTNPIAGLQVNAAEKFFAALSDGSVQEIPANLPAKTILNLFQMSDGNVVEQDW